MSEVIVVSALTFAAAYLFLRNSPTATSNPTAITPPALKSPEQVTTTNIHTRMGDAIGTGAELGVTRDQMGHTQRKAEVDVHVGGPALVPTKPPPMLSIQGSAALNTTPIGAPPTPAQPIALADALAVEARQVETVARAEKPTLLASNAPSTFTAVPARTLNLEDMKTPLSLAVMPYSTKPTGQPLISRAVMPSPVMPSVMPVRKAVPLVDALPTEALKAVQPPKITTVSAEPGDMLKAAVERAKHQDPRVLTLSSASSIWAANVRRTAPPPLGFRIV
jgi:hypothetical protein